MRFLFISILFIVLSSPAVAKVDCAKKERKIDVLNCVHDEYDRVEGNVRKAYLQAIYRLSQEGDQERMQLFRLSQQAWEDYRYKACDSQVTENQGLAKDFKLSTRICHTELADRRLKDILRHYKTWNFPEKQMTPEPEEEPEEKTLLEKE